MKTKKLILLIVVLLVTLLIILVACQEDEVDITYSDWAIDKLPTYKQPGQISRTASTGAICIFPLPVLSSEDYVKCVSKEATCEEKGEDTYTICALGEKYSFKIETDPIGHRFDEVEYLWTEEGNKCVARRVCLNDKTHIELAEGKIKSEETAPADCTNKGKTTYAATFEEDWATPQYKIMEDIDIEEEGHDFEDVEYTWNEDCTECSAKHVCKNNNEHYKIIVSTEVYSEVGLAPTNKSKGIIRFTPKFNENWANTFMDVDIPVLTDAKYMLEENLSESTAYKYGKGRYKYSYKGKVYEFISETKLKDMNYYLENKYFTSLANSYLYDGYSQENVDAMIETIKNNNVKAYNNKALKEMVDDYNLNHEIPLKVNIIKEKPMLNKILYEVITNADYDIQLLAYIKDETLNIFDKSNFVITENPLLLQKEIEIALAKKNIINKTIIVNDEILLINDNMNNNCTLFDMIGELEVNDFEDLMSKDGRFLINVRQTSSYYTIPQSVEYVLASALENQVSQITIPNTVRYIGDFGLSYIGKVNVEEGSNLEFIGINGLANCGDIELIKFTKLKVIDDKAFLGSKVENINLKNVEIIGERAFENCNNVKNISLGNYVKVIKSNAFKIETKNQNEIKVLIPTSTKVIGKNVFLNREKVEVYLEENLGEEWIDGWNNITSDGIIKTKVYKYNALEPVSLSLPVGIDGYWHYDDNMNMVKW